MDSPSSNRTALGIANSTITALIDLGYVLTLEESFAIKDRIADLLKETEESVNTGRYIMVKKNSE